MISAWLTNFGRYWSRYGGGFRGVKVNKQQCPNCLKDVIYEELRTAELAPKDVIGYNRTRVKQVIGRVFYHNDGTICDLSLYRVEKLQRPIYLRLGVPTVDPRI